MNNDEARLLLERALEAFRLESYDDLVRRIGSGPLVSEERGTASAYQIEIEFMWDGSSGGDVRVIGSIDDGGWRAFLPVTRSFIKAPDGSFVGE